MVAKSEIHVFEDTPHPSLLKTIGDSGHDFYQANADLFDNSFDAKARNICIDITERKTAKYKITIRDDGVGMTLQELQKAVSLGFSTKNTNTGDLGHYGLGLKSALGSLGEVHIIETTPKGSTKIFTYRNDLRNEKTQWINSVNSREGAVKNSSWTIIKIGELKHKTKDKIPRLKESAAKRYRKVLDLGQTNLTINKTLIEPGVIDLNDKVPTLEGAIEFEDKFYNYFLGYLANPSKSWGFNLFKNKRIIEEDQKDGMVLKGQFYGERGIYGEVDLNDFDTNHQKNEFLRNERFLEFQRVFSKEPKVKKWLKMIATYNHSHKEPVPLAKATQQKVTDLLEKVTRHIKNNNVLNDFDFKSIEKSNDENDIAKVLPTSLPPSSPPDTPNSNSSSNKSTDSKSRLTAPSVKWKVGNFTFEIKHHVEDLNDIDIIKTWDLINDNTLTVVINNGGRVYEAWRDTSIFITQEIVQSLVECLIDKKGVPAKRAFRVREDILNGAFS